MGKLPEARENTSGQARLVLGLLSDWLRGWHKISGPIPERDEAIPKKKNLESLSVVNEKLPIKLCRNFQGQLAPQGAFNLGNKRLNLDKNHGKLAKGVYVFETGFHLTADRPCVQGVQR